MDTAVQLNVSVPNVLGTLATLSDKLRAADVNISALTCTEGKSQIVVHLIVDDPETAKLVLQPLYPVTVCDVLALRMKNKPGAIAAITRACAAAKVNIRNIYATTCGKGKDALVYVLVDDIGAAKERLKAWSKSFGSLMPS